MKRTGRSRGGRSCEVWARPSPCPGWRRWRRSLHGRGPAQAASLPRRMAFLYVPERRPHARLDAHGDGSRFALPPTLQALEPFRNDLLVLSGPGAAQAGAHSATSAAITPARWPAS